MVYRRRRFGRRRFRRNVRRRRMLRKRRGRFTVTWRQDYPLTHASFIPAQGNVMGTNIGTPSGTYETFSVGILPTSLLTCPGKVGSWYNTAERIKTRCIGGTDKGNTTTQYCSTITDMPNCIMNTPIPFVMNCSALWAMNEQYRVSSISVTLTVPELTEGGPNKSLYVYWTNLPGAKASKPEDVRSWILPVSGDSLDQVSSTGSADAAGWNWVCAPRDIAEACSVPGLSSNKHGWHRAILTSSSPVTISWRPRHADIRFDHTLATDETMINNNRVRKLQGVDEFADSPKLVRSYLPTNSFTLSSAEVFDFAHYWMGPIVRIQDTDRPLQNDQSTSTITENFYATYGIRCSMTAKIKFRRFVANDPLFPSIRQM